MVENRNSNPRVLFRISTPNQLRIENGFVQPHNPESEFGYSIPLIKRKDLFDAAILFGGNHVLTKEKADYFLILSFRTKKLQRIVVPVNENGKEKGFFYAQAPIESIIDITKMKWLGRQEFVEAYDRHRFDLAVKYIGSLPIVEIVKCATSSFEEQQSGL